MESISARARIGCRVNPAEFLLAGVIVARSTSLLLSKALLTTMSPLNILSVRFCLAFVILCAIFFNRMKRMNLRTLLIGMAIGGAFSAMMAAELFALKHTLASTTSFLENTAIVIVPLMEALLHRKLPCKRALRRAYLNRRWRPHPALRQVQLRPRRRALHTLCHALRLGDNTH